MSKKIIELQPELVPHHKIASFHRDMNDAEFNALKLDIQENGQLVPVILYRNKLVDGRHRQRALIELGIHDMKAMKLPNNLSLEDVGNMVLGTEIRRTDNVAQRAIRAYRWVLETGAKQQDAAIKFAVNKSRVSDAKKLYEKLSPKDIDRLYRQGYLYIGGKKHTQMQAIIKALDTEGRDNEDKEPTSDAVKSILKMLDEMSNNGDMVGIVQIEQKAKKIRQNI
jgi:ParB-like chromosome segregation protein Spo0J